MTFRLRKIKSLLISAAVLLGVLTTAAVTGNILAGAVDVPETIIGDADNDGKVSINDVTCIQEFLAGFTMSRDFSKSAADVDSSGKIEIRDATLIQMWLAGMETSCQIGEIFTESSTQAQTEMPTDEDGWGRIIFQP